MDIKDIENLAELARLELSMTEKESLLIDLDGILGYVKIIEGVEVPEASEKYDIYNIWREDVIMPNTGNFSLELIKKQFPDSQDGFLKVKKIL